MILMIMTMMKIVIDNDDDRYDDRCDGDDYDIDTHDCINQTKMI